MSDLHLETYPRYSDYHLGRTDAPYIALLGDIGRVCDAGLFKLLRELMNHYDVVFFLLGNHEPYGCSFEQARKSVARFERQMAHLTNSSTLGKFVFLDQKRYGINSKVTILGCTLFSHIAVEEMHEVGNILNDFRRISDWTVHDHNEAHHKDVDWLNQSVMASARPSRQGRL